MKDYDAALDLELDSMDKFVLQCLAFYQVPFSFLTEQKNYRSKVLLFEQRLS